MPRPTNQPPQMSWITRMAACWRVWVTKGEIDSGQIYFKDSEFSGSKQKSLRAAKAFRDDFISRHKIRRRAYNGSGFHVKHAKSSSGMVGVVLSTDDPENITRVNWRAKVRKDWAEKGSAFSVRKYGYEKAWRMAIQRRCAHTGEPMPSQAPPPPQWLLAWANERGLTALADEIEAIIKARGTAENAAKT